MLLLCSAAKANGERFFLIRGFTAVIDVRGSSAGGSSISNRAGTACSELLRIMMGAGAMVELTGLTAKAGWALLGGGKL